MSLILSIETTSLQICSVALGENGRLISVKNNTEGLRHAAVLTQLIEDLFGQTAQTLDDLDAVAVSAGPGSYTGQRIGIATAKGLCYALDIPLIGVSTLEGLAWQAIQQTTSTKNTKNRRYVPMIDARRMEVYTATYDEQLHMLDAPRPKVLEADDFNEKTDQCIWFFFGNGAKKFEEMYAKENVLNNKEFISTLSCTATNLVQLADTAYHKQQFEDLSYFSGVYLKAYK